MDFQKFLRNEEVDFKGRLLIDIWNYTDYEIEANHDFIQLIFPLDKPSKAVFNNLFLKNNDQINTLRTDDLVKKNILKSSDWFLKFLINNNQWKNYSDHNQLRITRIIECLRLLISNKDANDFYNKITKLLGNDVKINSRTLKFWREA